MSTRTLVILAIIVWATLFALLGWAITSPAPTGPTVIITCDQPCTVTT